MRLLTVFAVALFTVFFAACGGSGERPDNRAQSASAQRAASDVDGDLHHPPILVVSPLNMQGWDYAGEPDSAFFTFDGGDADGDGYGNVAIAVEEEGVKQHVRKDAQLSTDNHTGTELGEFEELSYHRLLRGIEKTDIRRGMVIANAFISGDVDGDGLADLAFVHRPDTDWKPGEWHKISAEDGVWSECPIDTFEETGDCDDDDPDTPPGTTWSKVKDYEHRGHVTVLKLGLTTSSGGSSSGDTGRTTSARGDGDKKKRRHRGHPTILKIGSPGGGADGGLCDGCGIVHTDDWIVKHRGGTENPLYEGQTKEGTNVLYDMEPGPGSAEACPDGGWSDYGFKNEQVCRAFVRIAEARCLIGDSERCRTRGNGNDRVVRKKPGRTTFGIPPGFGSCDPDDDGDGLPTAAIDSGAKEKAKRTGCSKNLHSG